jgi:Zn-finger in ubiquitin-hydrolases and other protein
MTEPGAPGINPDAPPSGPGCADCDASSPAGWWVHLRRCAACGHVGCCDSSPGRHASRHAFSTSHPIVRSYEPGEDWFWCYVDQLMFELAGAPPRAVHP